MKFGLGTYSSVELGQRGIKTQVVFKYITEGACNPASEMHKHMTAMSRIEQRNCVLLFCHSLLLVKESMLLKYVWS